MYHDLWNCRLGGVICVSHVLAKVVSKLWEMISVTSELISELWYCKEDVIDYLQRKSVII